MNSCITYRGFKIIVILLIFFSSCASGYEDFDIDTTKDSSMLYTNPVWNESFPDPAIWQGDDGYYYAVATSLTCLLKSNDLVHWEDMGVSPVDEGTLTLLKKKGTHIWAPDVITVRGQRLMYLALHNTAADSRIVVLKESSSNGVFEYVAEITCSKENGIIDTIDPEVVYDESGRLWMFFGSTGGIHRIELTDDGLSILENSRYEHVAGLPILKDASRRYVYEGCYLYHYNGYWYMFASYGHYNSYDYGIVVGRSKTLNGEFRDRKGNKLTERGGTVILSTNSSDYFYGGGHNGEIFMDQEHNYYMFYHCHNKGKKSTTGSIPRPLMLQQLYWDDDGWPYFFDCKPASQGIMPIL